MREGCHPRVFLPTERSDKAIVLVHGLTDSPYFMIAIAFLVSHAGVRSIQVVTGAMGVIVATIGGLLSLYRFQEKWVAYRVTAENLKREKYFFLTGTASYHGDDNFATLVARVEEFVCFKQRIPPRTVRIQILRSTLKPRTAGPRL